MTTTTTPPTDTLTNQEAKQQNQQCRNYTLICTQKLKGWAFDCPYRFVTTSYTYCLKKWTQDPTNTQKIETPQLQRRYRNSP